MVLLLSLNEKHQFLIMKITQSMVIGISHRVV